MLDSDFLEKDLRLVSPLHVVYEFSREMFLMLYSINWSNFFVRLPLLLEILGNMSFAIACFPGGDVINFEIDCIVLIKLFFCMTKKSKI